MADVPREPIRILHVDDEPDFAEVTATLLERGDDRFTVGTATSADEGLAAIDDDPPDCVVSDYSMPGTDGIGFLQAVRERYPELPFIMYTGSGSEDVASDAISAGVTDYLQKGTGPGQYERLADRIRNAVRARCETEQADRQAERIRLTEVIATILSGEEVTVETDLLTADGQRLPYELTGARLTDPDGTATGLVGVARDLSERRQRERELATLKNQYQTLAENFPDGGVFLFDEDLRYVRARGTGLQTVGLTPDDVEGATPHDLFPDETADRIAQYYRRALEGNGHTFEQEYQGEQYRIKTVPVRADDGEVTYGMSVSQNVTEQTERRRELERQNERLDEFASIVSHDLRNPLRAARTRLDLAVEECDTPHLTDAMDALDRSEALVDDLLALARGGVSESDLETVPLDSLVAEVWGTVETRQATLGIETDRTVRADGSRLRQLLENLLTNAVEHGGDDVSVTVGSIDDGFFVEDTGPGIPDDSRETVFEAGFTTSETGTGFGLRIVEQVASAHGWELRVTDGTDGGARVEVTGAD